MARVSLTGNIGKPMITLHGTLDTLLPPATDSDVYATLIAQAGRAELHRYYVIEAGTHVDALYDQFPDRLRPMLPCYRAAFEALEGWMGGGRPPGPAGAAFVPKPAEGHVVKTCSL